MPAGPATEKVNVGMTKNEARKMAYAVLEYMVAFASAQIVATMWPPAAAVATAPREKLTLDETDAVLDDLFGAGATPRKKPKSTGQTPRGRVVTTPVGAR